MKDAFSTFMLQTPCGPVRIVASQKGIARLEFCPKKSEFRNSASSGSPLHKLWVHEIRNRLAGKKPSMKLPLDFHGTIFQKSVWRALCRIPHGETCSYAQIAKSIGKPRASRAVAAACGANRIGVLVPCHRVVRSDGSLGGYHWGSRLKRRLLENEGVLLPLSQG